MISDFRPVNALPQPAAEWTDVPPFEYTLIRETASVPVDSARFDIMVGPRDGIQWETGPAGGGTLKIMGYKEIACTGAFPLDMNGDKPANTMMLTLELKSGALHLVSTLAIPAPAAPAPPGSRDSLKYPIRESSNPPFPCWGRAGRFPGKHTSLWDTRSHTYLRGKDMP